MCAQALDVVHTLSCPSLNKIRKVFYPPGPPVIHNDILGVVDAQGEAIA